MRFAVPRMSSMSVLLSSSRYEMRNNWTARISLLRNKRGESKRRGSITITNHARARRGKGREEVKEYIHIYTYIYVIRERKRFVCRRRYFFSHRGSAREKLGGKTADLHDKIGTFESEPNENVTESASPLKASSFR